MKCTWLLIIATALCGLARADCSVTPSRVDALGNTVGVFNKDGKFLEEMPKSALDGVRVLDCNENLGLIQVKLTSGESKWLDRGELRLTYPDSATKPKVCVVAAASRAADHTEAVVAGVDPEKNKNCVPPKPAKP